MPALILWFCLAGCKNLEQTVMSSILPEARGIHNRTGHWCNHEVTKSV